MQKHVQIDDFDITLIVKKRSKSVAIEMLISKDVDSELIRDDTVAVIIEATGGALLNPKGWPDPGYLPETMSLGATANAYFTFANPDSKTLKRLIVVFRGAFAEVSLR